MTNDGGVDFFISYTSTDVAWARWISHVLESAGYRVVVQDWDFGAGNFVAHMEDAVRRATRLLPVLSEAYLTSDWSREEWTAFARERSAIIPVQIAEVEARSMLRQYQRVNLQGLHERAAQDRLLAKLRTLAGPPTQGSITRGEEAPFPGEPPKSEPRHRPIPLAEPAPDRVQVEPGHLQLVVFGPGSTNAAEQLLTLFDVPQDGMLDLQGSPLSVPDQLATLKALLDDLDADAVTDVVVAFIGRGSVLPALGMQLHVASTDPKAPQTFLTLQDLLRTMAEHRGERRAWMLIDALDECDCAINPPSVWGDIPVLDLRGPSGGGLAELMALLTGPSTELARNLRHRAPLTLSDLAELTGDALHVPADWLTADVGLARNPLAWPAHPLGQVNNWCVVLSTADSERPEASVGLAIRQLEANRRKGFNAALRGIGRDTELDIVAARVPAGDVLASPAALAHAVEQVCRADIAIFDLTNFEPAAMLLLGIRSVIRRGVTLCTYTAHADPVRAAELPFHIREISLLAGADSQVMARRLRAGLKQLGLPGRTYADLPSFQLARNVPPDPGRRASRPFQPNREPVIIALVPFNADYISTHWAQLGVNLADAAAAVLTEDIDDGDEEEVEVGVVRTLDLDSPRIVSEQLYETMRLTDFCLVDLTTARPNVLFELGVRLVINPLHPVLVRDPDAAHPFAGEPWGKEAMRQCEQLCRLLNALDYRPYVGPMEQYRQMIKRHLELRDLEIHPHDPRQGTVLNGFPPRAVYDLAWRYAVANDEVVTIPAEERLEAEADKLLVDPRLGGGHLVYPEQHPLNKEAERTGREHLLAAWLYLHFRRQAAIGSQEARARYEAVTERLLLLLEGSADESDIVFARQIEAWRTGDGEGNQP